ncbi:hypothetical protein Baya_8225 [Bagarius yarrelli]|uniref:Uncharacterized protein n=1 Tax=Bagarius yarrelli TaxID=175774 RepID=A0A556U3J9_BAGYA|nr:hypothetical protein Baya_8225 [Bagarius yarrelli]
MVGSLFHMTAFKSRKAAFMPALVDRSPLYSHHLDSPNSRPILPYPLFVIDPIAFSPLTVSSACSSPHCTHHPHPHTLGQQNASVQQSTLPLSSALRRRAEDGDSWQTSQKPSYVSRESKGGELLGQPVVSFPGNTSGASRVEEQQRYSQLDEDKCPAMRVQAVPFETLFQLVQSCFYTDVLL